MKELPSKYIEFGEKLSALVKDYDLMHFSAEFTPKPNQNWPKLIKFSWGRHGNKNNTFSLSSHVFVSYTGGNTE